MSISPTDGLIQIDLQMEDRALPSMIGQVRVVVLMNDKKHDGPGTEIERNIVAHFGPRVTGHIYFEPSAFYFCHADGSLRDSFFDPLPIAFDITTHHNGGQVVDMGDMVNFRAIRWCCHALLAYPSRSFGPKDCQFIPISYDYPWVEPLHQCGPFQIS